MGIMEAAPEQQRGQSESTGGGAAEVRIRWAIDIQGKDSQKINEGKEPGEEGEQRCRRRNDGVYRNRIGEMSEYAGQSRLRRRSADSSFYQAFHKPRSKFSCVFLYIFMSLLSFISVGCFFLFVQRKERTEVFILFLGFTKWAYVD